MLKLFVVFCTGLALVYCAPQRSDVEIEDQTFNRINEAEYDYRFVLSDGHEQEQLRKEKNGIHVVTGFYKYTDPDGKVHQIYYKADDKGYQISYDKPFDLTDPESERLTDLSNTYLPPNANLVRDATPPSNSYLPPNADLVRDATPPSNSYLPPN